MPIPLHSMISKQLRDRMISGQYKPGDQLPSEHQLMSEFEVSRITARRAIANLMQQGLVVVQQGKGAFVADQQKVIHTLSSPLLLEADMAQQDVTITVRTLVFELVTVPPEVEEILSVSIAYFQKKVLLFNGVPGCVDITYIVPELGKAYAKDLKKQLSLTALEKHGIHTDKIDAIIECTQADDETSEHLEVPLGHPLIVYQHTAYTDGNCAIVHGKSISRGDRLCYSVQIKRK
ncbi:MAG: GntR family transcriptional regulator [Phormidium tanganyikae FI6-MK23]|jgi:GntR family transcriptional regulator|nr:GntR family transcriptional regulator [Phormidium tanganyikae FI6-MK23]